MVTPNKIPRICPLLSMGREKMVACIGLDCMLCSNYDGSCVLADRRRFFKELVL